MTKRAKNKSNGSQGKVRRTPRGGPRKVSDQRVFARSRLTNGKDLLPFVDQRSHFARIMRDSLNRLLEHCGGEAGISETRRMMARRCACLETELIFMESKFSRCRAEGGEPSVADVDAYARIAGNQRRIADALGWQRVARDVTPDPLTYAKQIDAEDAEVMEA